MTIIQQKDFSSLKKGICVSLLLAVIMALLDLYIGVFYSIISWRTYAAFFVAYFLLNILIVLLIFIFKKIFHRDSINIFIILIFALLFLFDFIIVNVKLNGWFNFLNMRSIFDNSLLIVLFLCLIFAMSKIKIVQNHLTKISFQTAYFTLSFATISIINFFWFNFPEVPNKKSEVIIFTFILGLIPIVSILLLAILNLFMKKIALDALSSWFIFAIIIVLFLVVIPGIKNPDISHFYIKGVKYQPSPENPKKPNVLWIVLDTARRDHFSCYGAERKVTPNIDKFAEDGVLFTNYISTAPWTLPSHSSLFTGLYSSEHGARFAREGPLYFPMPKEVKTVAEILSENGWKTAAISANTMISKRNNFDQGFQFFYSKQNTFREFFWGMLTSQIFPDIWNKWGFLRINVYSLSSELNEVVFHWLKKNRDEPFFLFLNYMEPHHGGKYIPGEAGRRFGVDWGLWNDMYKSLDLESIVHKKKKISEHDYQLNRDWLDTKMAYLDENLGHLFDFLKANNLYDNSYLFLLSDHGDLFGEHYSFGHTMELYNELIHVPLIIKYPKDLQMKGVNDKFVQNVDLLPELLSNLNIPIPKQVSGQPLGMTKHDIISELFRRSELTLNKPRYNRDLKAIFDISKKDLFKFIQSSNGRHELYDLKIDSLELHNIYSEEASLAEKLNNRLNEWRKSVKTIKRNESELKKLDKKTKDRLRALGYIR